MLTQFCRAFRDQKYKDLFQISSAIWSDNRPDLWWLNLVNVTWPVSIGILTIQLDFLSSRPWSIAANYRAGKVTYRNCFIVWCYTCSESPSLSNPAERTWSRASAANVNPVREYFTITGLCSLQRLTLTHRSRSYDSRTIEISVSKLMEQRQLSMSIYFTVIEKRTVSSSDFFVKHVLLYLPVVSEYFTC